MQKRVYGMFLLGTMMAFGITTGLQAAELPKISSDQIGRLTLVKDGEEVFHISNEPEDYKLNFDYWEVLNPYQESNTVNTETMFQLYDTVLGLDFGSPVEVPEGESDGLDGSETYLEIGYVSDTESGNIAEPDSVLKIIFGGETEDGGRYVRIDGIEEVYALTSAAAESVLGIEPFDYILKIPVLMNIEHLEGVEITLDDDTFTMEKDGEKYRLNGKKVDKTDFTTLYQALMNIFFDAETEVNQEREREEILRVAYRMKETAPDAEVVYYSWEDDAYYAVEINGTEQFLVSAEEVDALLEQIRDTF